MSLENFADEYLEYCYPAITYAKDKTASLSLGLSNEINDNCDLLSHILLIFDFFYISRKNTCKL